MLVACKSVKQNQQFRVVFAEVTWGQTQQLQLFALLNLGLIQSLTSGVVSAAEAVKQFYHAENCLYIKNFLSNNIANSIMSHGV
jgi:hypothetical protein